MSRCAEALPALAVKLGASFPACALILKIYFCHAGYSRSPRKKTARHSSPPAVAAPLGAAVRDRFPV